jgi:hypothetical protein
MLPAAMRGWEADGMGDRRDGGRTGIPESGGGPSARAGGGQITYARVVNDTLDALWAHGRYIPRIAWPAMTCGFLYTVAGPFLPPPWAPFLLALIPVWIAFEVMAGTAWIQIVALGPKRARTRTFGWGRAEWNGLLFAALGGIVVVALAYFLLTEVAFRRHFGPGPPILENTTKIFYGILAPTLTTPLLLLLPARVLGRSLPIWTMYRNRTTGSACAEVWAFQGFVLAAPVLLLDQMPRLAPATFAPPPAMAGLAAVQTALYYLLAYTCITVLTVMAAQLGSWPRHARVRIGT